MKSNFKKIVTILGLFILTNSYLYAQLIEVPLERKIEYSTLVIEGKVKRSEAFVASDEKIYTAHEIEIYKILKGTEFYDDKVTVITMGGEVDGLSENWSHFLTLDFNETGIFFLKTTNRPHIDNKSFPSTIMEVYSSTQGFFQYHKEKGENTVTTPFKHYNNTGAEIFETIRKQTKESVKIVKVPSNFEKSGGEKDRCIIYSIEPARKQQNLKIGADIKIRIPEGTAKLYQSLVVMEYDTTFFGSNVVQNGFLELSDGDISALSTYNMTAIDVAPNKLQLKLVSTGNLFNLYPLTTQKSFLVSVYLSIANPFGNFEVDFDYTAMEQGNLLYDDILQGTKQFECIKFESEVFPMLCPEIMSFTPDTVAAGVGIESESGVPGMITITGDKFGTPSLGQYKPDNYRVGFKRIGGGWVYPPERDIISWTNTEIKVQVPSVGYNDTEVYSSSNRAGTGNIIVERTDIDSCFSEKGTLYIRFSVRNSSSTFTSDGTKKSKIVKLSDRDDDGGYSIYFTDEFKNQSGAVNAFTRALNTWRCETYVNFDIKEQNEIPNADGACSVDFVDELPDGTISTTVARTYRAAATCGNGDLSHLYSKNFRMYFLSRVKLNSDTLSLFWYTSNNFPTPELDYKDSLDLETVALHELGHAMLLNHVLNQGTVMYTPVKLTLRSLEEDAKLGGTHSVDLSTSAPNCEGVMVKLTESDCEIGTAVTEIKNANDVFRIFPNPANDMLFLELIEGNKGLNISKYLIYNMLGQPVFEKRGEKYTQSEQLDIHHLPKGYYTLKIEIGKGDILVTSFLKI